MAAVPSIRGLRLASLILTGQLTACGAPEPEQAGCAGALAEGLFNASGVESYLGLAPEELRAVVRITSGSEEAGAPLCTGTLVASEWVLTAAHCLRIEPAEVVLGGGELAIRSLPVLGSARHPSADVALVRVDAAAVASLGVRPLPVAAWNEVSLSPGEAVELAGYGATEDGAAGELRFLVEPLVRVEPQLLTVDGFGVNGACSGDSGGPLLVRGARGAVVVAGVLSIGSSTCVDGDSYVRLDQLEAWITETIGVSSREASACGGITPEGRCLYGKALWCERGALVAEACAADRRCGWDARQSGFRCVDAQSDPCQGVDAIGTCIDGGPAWCNTGVLERATCGCAASCRIQGRTGKPYCS